MSTEQKATIFHKYWDDGPDFEGEKRCHVLCSQCGHIHNLRYHGWSAIVCLNCGEEIRRKEG